MTTTTAQAHRINDTTDGGASDDTGTLHFHNCKERRGINVTFSTEDQAIAYYEARTATHAVWEVEDDEKVSLGLGSGSVPITWTRLHALLYPVCEHGMSADMCEGPMHFLSAAQEMARGW
jgi:hypothetical protein